MKYKTISEDIQTLSITLKNEFKDGWLYRDCLGDFYEHGMHKIIVLLESDEEAGDGE